MVKIKGCGFSLKKMGTVITNSNVQLVASDFKVGQVSQLGTAKENMYWLLLLIIAYDGPMVDPKWGFELLKGY